MQDRDPTQPGAARARTTARRRQPLALPAVRQPDPVRRGPGHPRPGVRACRPGRRRSGGGARSPGRDGRARHLSLVWVGRLGRRRAPAASGWGAGGAVTLPLAGLRVLDLSRLLPGGYCTLVPVSYTHLTLPTNREV